MPSGSVRASADTERGALLDQLELQLADLEENAAQAETTAQMAAAEKIGVSSFERRKPARRPLPEHLPRERGVYPVPAICPCCGDSRLRKIGEDMTETLELIPRQRKVIQHVREKFACRACLAITQPPATSHPIARGLAGTKLLAHIPFAKYGLHLPLNRQSDVYRREGIDLDVSTLADWVGDAYAGFSRLYEANRKGGQRAARTAGANSSISRGSARRRSPLRRSNASMSCCHRTRDQRPYARGASARTPGAQPSLIVELQAWLREQRASLSRSSDTTKAINYCLSRWDAFTRFLDDGRVCMA